MMIRSVYPNPANDKLNIDVIGRGANSDCELNIYDQLGRPLVNEDRILKFGANKMELDVESLRPGIYYLEIRTKNGSMVSRQLFSKQ